MYYTDRDVLLTDHFRLQKEINDIQSQIRKLEKTNQLLDQQNRQLRKDLESLYKPKPIDPKYSVNSGFFPNTSLFSNYTNCFANTFNLLSRASKTPEKTYSESSSLTPQDNLNSSENSLKCSENPLKFQEKSLKTFETNLGKLFNKEVLFEKFNRASEICEVATGEIMKHAKLVADGVTSKFFVPSLSHFTVDSSGNYFNYFDKCEENSNFKSYSECVQGVEKGFLNSYNCNKDNYKDNLESYREKQGDYRDKREDYNYDKENYRDKIEDREKLESFLDKGLQSFLGKSFLNYDKPLDKHDKPLGKYDTNFEKYDRNFEKYEKNLEKYEKTSLETFRQSNLQSLESVNADTVTNLSSNESEDQHLIISSDEESVYLNQVTHTGAVTSSF